LAEVCTTWGKASDRLWKLVNEQTQQKPCQMSSDIGAEQENHTVGRGST
jgi:hypothetical protein